ncbi:molybdopterin synthase catalytic subunit-like [Corticium candelabrum]|uniref:molybdopterin synthase catalytic subunit-like n=1 Tax=Corticium candelabrum TaxID=121492 RepID=UPI002E276597|nr:molybdopterin synthase catalytic subunit-like [Corticium candelabrum]
MALDKREEDTWVLLTDEQLSINDATSFVVCSSTGAVSVFVGTTRDLFEGKKVVKLQYEAYTPMAVKKIKKVCQDIRVKWPVHRIAVLHRLGVVSVSEASVIIAISSIHRQEAIEAVHYCIDMLKAQVPIWKKELYEDGNETWKENKECWWAVSST